MTAFRVAREDDFDFGSAEYAELHADSDATAFQHPTWLTGIYDVLAPRRGATKVVVTVRDDRGKLRVVLPFVRRRRGVLRMLEFADLGVNDYAAAILSHAGPPLDGDADLPRRIRTALGRFDLLRVERVADSPRSLRTLIKGARAKRHLYDTHLVELPGSPEAWTEQLDPKFARHLERKYKRLRPKGERQLRVVTDVTEVEPMLRRMQAFRAARFADRRGVDLVQDEDCFAFYRSVAERGLGSGPGRLVALDVGGQTVAVAFDLVERDRDLFVLVGYDVERLRNYSLGLLVVDQLVQEAIGRGQRAFDLTVGDESYKSDFGAHPRKLFEVRLARTPQGLAALVARDAYLRARRVAKQALTLQQQAAAAVAKQRLATKQKLGRQAR